MNKLSVKIIMCTYNGEKFISEQLQSIKKQSFINWSLYIYDDLSFDNTINIIKSFQKENPGYKINLKINKKRLGYYQNFIKAIEAKSKKFDLIFLSDQDDFWLPDKIDSCLKHYDKTLKPFFYFSKRIVSCKNLNKLYISPDKNYSFSFYHSFFQNLAGGNTIAFNNIFLEKYIEKKVIHNHYVHDWELFIFANSINQCKIIYDHKPTILYRQHPEAAIGTGGFKILLLKIYKLTSLNYKYENSKRINFILSNPNCFQNEYIKFIKEIYDYREKTLINRLLNIHQLKFCKYRYNFFKRTLWVVFVFIGLF